MENAELCRFSSQTFPIIMIYHKYISNYKKRPVREKMLMVYQKEKKCCYNIWIWATLKNVRFDFLIKLRGDRARWLVGVQTKGIVSTKSKWTGDRCDQNVAIDVTLTSNKELIGQKSQNKSSSVICLTISYHGHSARRIQTEYLKKRTVLATVWANSSKFNFPSPSWSASMIVLSTICCSCWSCDQTGECNRGDYARFIPSNCCLPSSSAPKRALHWRWIHLDRHRTRWRRLKFERTKASKEISFSIVKREIATNISVSLPDHRDYWMRSALQRILGNRLCLRHCNSHESWTFIDCTPPNGTHSSSKIAIIREANGFVAIWGIWRNSSRSIDPEPSLLLVRLVVTNWTQTQHAPI